MEILRLLVQHPAPNWQRKYFDEQVRKVRAAIAKAERENALESAETRGAVGKLFLICSRDDSVAAWPPKGVHANTATEAMATYLRAVYAKDDLFRETVLDLGVNMSFVERFYLSSEQESVRFNETAKTGTEPEIVRSRVRQFFGKRPDIGDRFLRYMDTHDRNLIDDELLEFIAENESEEQHGFVVIDPDAVDMVR